MGAQGKDQSLIKRLLANHHCEFLSEQQLTQKPALGFDAIVFVCRRTTNEPIPSALFSHSVRRVIIISDCVDEDVIVQALSAGADYFLNFSESERVLSARLEAALRSHSDIVSRTLVYQPYTFNTINRTVCRDNKNIPVTHREFELALYLFSNQGKIVTDSDLLTWVWNLSSSAGTRRINTTMYKVKKKLRLRSTSKRWELKRLYAEGYRLTNKLDDGHLQQAN